MFDTVLHISLSTDINSRDGSGSVLPLGKSAQPALSTEGCCCISTQQAILYTTYSLVPRPTPFFVLRFAFNIIHGGRRARKMGKAWEHLSRE